VRCRVIVGAGVATAAVTGTAGTLSGTRCAIGAANALDSPFPGSVYIAQNNTQNHCNYRKDNQIYRFHFLGPPFSVYSDARRCLVFLIAPTITRPNAATAARPRIAAGTCRVSGAVTSVPMV